MNIYKIMMKCCVCITRCFYVLSTVKQFFNIDIRFTSKRMKALPKEGVGRDLFIILNGPSLRNQDLSILKDKDIMFVNRGFMHPLYKELQPKYHVFVDPKFADGTWPLDWLDQIFEMCPYIRIIMPVKWHNNPHFSKYKDDKRIFWQYWTLPLYVNGVSNNCFSYGISQKFENIFFTGFDANGCAYDMIKQSESSHFYGADPELKQMTTSQHMQAMFTTFIQFADLLDTSKYCIKHNISIYNLTDGGLLDMFVRRDFNDLYNKATEIPIAPNVL